MHILLVHQAFAALDEPGGTRHHELARYLDERGYQVTVIASPVSYLTGASSREHSQATDFLPPAHDASEPVDRVNILRAYTYTALHKSFVHRVISFFSFMISSFLLGLRVRQVDLIWGTSPPIFQGITAWLLARLKGVPFLFEVRDLWPAFAIQVGVLRNPLLISASEWLEKFLYHRADLVMVNSPGFIDHVSQRGARRVALVPNGSDSRMFDPLSLGNEFRQAHALQGKFILLYAGAHGMSNDLGIVLQAAEKLTQRQEITLVFLGDGKEKPILIEQAQRLDLQNVLFLPPMPKQQVNQAIAAADACIAILKPISLYATVYPNKVFDYMAAGRAVILAIDGVIRKVVEEAQAGIFVEPGDPAGLAEAAIWLADHAEERQAMGARGRQMIEQRFDRQLIGAQLAAILEQL